jgi:hypothetical protein
MPITEGTENQQAPAPVQAVVDSKALGVAFAHAMQQAGYAPNQGAAQPAPKSLDQMFSELKANPENDEATLDSMRNLFETFRQELGQTNNQTLMAELSKQRNAHTINVIKMALDSHINGDPIMKENLDFLQDRVIKRFNTEEKFADARIRYGHGDVDVDVLKDLALDEINKFNKLRGADQKSKSPTGLRSGGGMQESAAIASERNSDENGSNLDPSKLDQQERDLYNAKISIAQKMGHARDSEKALAMASKAVTNLRNGRAQAKAKGLR